MSGIFSDSGHFLLPGQNAPGDDIYKLPNLDIAVRNGSVAVGEWQKDSSKGNVFRKVASLASVVQKLNRNKEHLNEAALEVNYGTVVKWNARVEIWANKDSSSMNERFEKLLFKVRRLFEHFSMEKAVGGITGQINYLKSLRRNQEEMKAWLSYASELHNQPGGYRPLALVEEPPINSEEGAARRRK